jgi:hypothetical protein
MQDPLFEKAKQLVEARNIATCAILQQTFLIGYNRASRLIASLQEADIISLPNADGRRTVPANEPHHPTATEQAKMSLHAHRAKQLEASRDMLLAGSLAREAAEEASQP